MNYHFNGVRRRLAARLAFAACSFLPSRRQRLIFDRGRVAFVVVDRAGKVVLVVDVVVEVVQQDFALKIVSNQQYGNNQACIMYV